MRKGEEGGKGKRQGAKKKGQGIWGASSSSPSFRRFLGRGAAEGNFSGLRRHSFHGEGLPRRDWLGGEGRRRREARDPGGARSVLTPLALSLSFSLSGC